MTPLDREDISNLASSLDDVIDWIEEVGRRVRLYRIESITPIACQFSRVILEQAEWLLGRGQPDDAQPLLVNARETFEQLEAKPWLEQVDAARIATLDEIPA